jgi:hypothetical protein
MLHFQIKRQAKRLIGSIKNRISNAIGHFTKAQGWARLISNICLTLPHITMTNGLKLSYMNCHIQLSNEN